MRKPAIKSKFFGKLDEPNKQKWKKLYEDALKEALDGGNDDVTSSRVAVQKADGAVKGGLVRKAIIPWGILTFEDLDEYNSSAKKAGKLTDLIQTYQFMIENILCDGGEDIDIAVLLRAASNDFVERVDAILSDSDGDSGDALKSESEDNDTPSFVFKDDDGKWRFLGVYSNNIIDKHAEILSAAAHKEFVAAVKSGDAPYPFLYFWHTLKMGQADFIDYDDDTGMAIVGGYFHDNSYDLAEAIAKSGSPLGMSHGMPKSTIVQEGNVIKQYRSYEVSLLPRERAANLLTSFEYYGEQSMAKIHDKLKEALGLPDEVIQRFVAQIEKQSAAADAVGLKRKDGDASNEGDVEGDNSDVGSDESATDTQAAVEEKAAAPEQENYVTLKSLQDLAEEIKSEFKKLKELIPDVAPILKRLGDTEAVLGAILESPSATQRELSQKSVSVLGWDIANDGGTKKMKSDEKPDGPKPDLEFNLGGNPLSGL